MSFTSVTPAATISFEDIVTMNIQLNKWTSQQIVLARSRFKKGLSREDIQTLDLNGFLSVFPSLSRLPKRIANSAFRLFDKNSSNDIDFKEFCYTLSPLIHGDLEEKHNFAFNLFDIEQKSGISLKDLKCALNSFEVLNKNTSVKEILEQDLVKLAKEAESLIGERNLLPMEDFVHIMEERVPLESVIELFEVIPSPAKEYKIINELITEGFTNESQQQCHIISCKWWNMWLNFVKNESPKTSNSIHSRPGSEPSVSLNMSNLSPRRSDTNKIIFIKNNLERPGEIDNTDIEGSIKETLKDGLRYLNDYKYIPNSAWERLHEWYGGGPKFERILITTPEGKRIVELYPLVLYTKVANGVSNYPYLGFVISKTHTIEQAISIIKKKFCSSEKEARLWYRYNVVGSVWKLVNDPKKTIDELSLNHGDKLILELKTSKGWALDNVTKEELEWEASERLDIYCQRSGTWKEGVIKENKKTEIVVELEEGEILTLEKTSPYVAPYRKHTVHTIQNVVTPDIRKKLDNEFKQLKNLGNT